METNEEYHIDRSKVVKNEVIMPLHHLFIQKLGEAYAGEKAIIRAMPVLGSIAVSVPLKDLMEQYRTSSVTHLDKIEFVFYMMGEQAKEGTSALVDGLLRKTKKIPSDFDCDWVADVGMICILTQVISLQLTLYETLGSLARTLGKSDVASELHVVFTSKKKCHDSFSEIMEALEAEMQQNYTES